MSTPRGLGPRPVQVQLGERITIDVHGRDGSRARVHGILDQAPDISGYGGPATRLVIRDARAEPLSG